MMTETERAIWIATYAAAMANNWNEPDTCGARADKAVRDVQSVAGEGAREIREQIWREKSQEQ